MLFSEPFVNQKQVIMKKEMSMFCETLLFLEGKDRSEVVSIGKF